MTETGSTQTGSTQTGSTQTGSTRSATFSWAGFTGPDGGPLPPSVRERIGWYDERVKRQRIGYYASEIVVLLLAASIPAAVAAGASTAVAGVLGALTVVAGGLRQLFRWGENWIRSSGVLVALQAEVVNWSRGTAPYDTPSTATGLLATRVEAMVLTESADWAALRREAAQTPPGLTPPGPAAQ